MRTGTVENILSEFRDRRRHGGGEQQRLALAPAQRNDLAHVVDEAHVEHAVGLVEDEDRDLVEAHMALLAKIEQAPGRGDQDIDARFQRLHLMMLVDAAEDDGSPQRKRAAVNAEALGDLARELSRRRQDQGPRRAG